MWFFKSLNKLASCHAILNHFECLQNYVYPLVSVVSVWAQVHLFVVVWGSFLSLKSKILHVYSACTLDNVPLILWFWDLIFHCGVFLLVGLVTLFNNLKWISRCSSVWLLAFTYSLICAALVWTFVLQTSVIISYFTTACVQPGVGVKSWALLKRTASPVLGSISPLDHLQISNLPILLTLPIFMHPYQNVQIKWLTVVACYLHVSTHVAAMWDHFVVLEIPFAYPIWELLVNHVCIWLNE